MTAETQITEQTGPSTEGLPGFLVVDGGVWYRDYDTWRVEGVKKGTPRK
jgi:hypothetical protein